MFFSFRPPSHRDTWPRPHEARADWLVCKGVLVASGRRAKMVAQRPKRGEEQDLQLGGADAVEIATVCRGGLVEKCNSRGLRVEEEIRQRQEEEERTREQGRDRQR